MHKTIRAGFVSGSMFTVDPQGKYRLRKHDYRSLVQWMELFDSVVLYFTEVPFDRNKETWEIITDPRVSFISICNHDDSIRKKWRSIRLAAKNASAVCDIFYYRLPSYEPMFFHFFRNRHIPYFVELHGDHETATLTSPQFWFKKYPLAKFVAYYTKKMCAHAAFVYTIGEALMKKYVPDAVPQHITTNHLTSKYEYPKQLPYRDASKPFSILFVGAIQERKGLLHLFKVLHRLRTEDVHFRMLVVGEGEQKKKLESFANENGFRDRVVFYGQVPHGPELYSIYQQADLFVLPSVSAEGVPRVTHEAMIFGCPVIATDIGSVKWQLSGGAGILVEPGDEDALYCAIKRVMEDKNTRYELIVKGFEKSKLYSWEAQKEGNNAFAIKQMKQLFGENA